jgi:uncharacterized glyoxalase superfamily protein PhnB
VSNGIATHLTVLPYFFCKDVAAAIGWLGDAFGFSELRRTLGLS